MIIRKPFKFLIEHFKIINFILLLLIGYITFKCGAIVGFFRNFVQMNYVTTKMNLVNSYIGFLLPLCIVAVILISLVIFILFKSKDKDNKVYLGLMVFYCILFIGCTLCRGILDNYEFGMIETSTALLYRDISQFAFYPNFIFMILVFLNVIGFDLRTFSFTNLQDDIDIASDDDAEIEIGVQIEDYKIKRGIRRTLRELRYYVIENKLVFTFIGGIIGIILLFYVGNFIIGLRRTVRVEQAFNHSNFNLKVEDSIITNIDYKGNKLSKDNYYLAVLISVTNKSNSSKVLDTDNFWLDIGGRYLYPILDKSAYFLDLGEPYYGDKINASESHKYVFVYELTSKQIKSSYNIKILDKIEYKEGIANPLYKQINLKPIRYYDVNNGDDYKLGDYVYLGNTRLLKSSVRVNSFDITNLYNYKYQYCYKEECSEKLDSISTGYNTKKILLVLDDEIIIDDKSNYKLFKKSTNFYEDFVTIQYGYGGELFESNVVDKSSNKDISGNTVLEVDSNITKAEWAYLVITVRDQRFFIYLT